MAVSNHNVIILIQECIQCNVRTIRLLPYTTCGSLFANKDDWLRQLFNIVLELDQVTFELLLASNLTDSIQDNVVRNCLVLTLDVT